MGVPMVRSCCFCGSLHTGTLVIGYLYTVWALLDLAVYSLLVTLAPLGKNGIISTHKLVFYSTAAVVSGTHLICSVLLVVAAYKTPMYLTEKENFVRKPAYPYGCVKSTNPHQGSVVDYGPILFLLRGGPCPFSGDEYGLGMQHYKLAFLTLPWTIVTGIITAIFFLLGLTGISLILQDTGEMLQVESIVVMVHLARAFVSVYCIVVVHSRHKQIMHEEDESRFQHSGRLYRPVKTADHAL